MPMAKNSTRVLFLGVCLLTGPKVGYSADTKADLVRHDYAEERVVDISIVKKVTGKKNQTSRFGSPAQIIFSWGGGLSETGCRNPAPLCPQL